MVKIKARFIKEIYYNSDNDYHVQKVMMYSCNEKLEILEKNYILNNSSITITGTGLPCNTRNTVEYMGEFREDSKYGIQFQVSMFEDFVDHNEKSIIGYLSSGIIPGIGKAAAKKIYQKFGTDTLEILKKDPDQMKVVELSEKKIASVMEYFKVNASAVQNVTFLTSIGMNAKLAIKVHQHFSMNNLEERIRENPYLLCSVDYISFSLVEEIAKKLSFPMNSEKRIEAGIIEALKENETTGSTGCLATTLLSLLHMVLSHSYPDQELINEVSHQMIRNEDVIARKIGDEILIFRPEAFHAESDIAMKLSSFLETIAPGYIRDMDGEIHRYEKRTGMKLHENQKEAVRQGLRNKLTIVTGGPGTGKTSVLKTIVNIFEDSFPEKRVMLLAPTGKAARGMSESTGKPASTVHSALGLRIQEDDEESEELQMLAADYIIVDEFSMVDIWVMQKLVTCIPDFSRLLLVGDADQLPSVQCGAVLHDLIESGEVPVVRLTKIFRQDEDSTILSNSLLIKEKKTCLKTGKDFHFYEELNPVKIVERVVALYCEAVDQYGKENVIYLVPQRKGLTGFEEMNRRIQDYINPKMDSEEMKSFEYSYRAGDMVMHLVNENEVSNGDVGRVIKIAKDKNGSYMDVLYFSDTTIRYYRPDLDKITLAYAISIHKSQGTEVPYVIMSLSNTQPLPLRTRNLLYTGITRAKKEIALVGDALSVKNCILKDGNKRITALGEILHQVHQKEVLALQERNPFEHVANA